MDFDQAIAAHAAWKQKLAKYIKQRDGSLNAAELSLDNKCPLGQWIYGEGSKHASQPVYAKLKSEHARFHKAVGELVRRADAGQSIEGEITIGSKSEFMMASAAVVGAIVSLKNLATQGKADSAAAAAN